MKPLPIVIDIVYNAIKCSHLNQTRHSPQQQNPFNHHPNYQYYRSMMNNKSVMLYVAVLLIAMLFLTTAKKIVTPDQVLDSIVDARGLKSLRYDAQYFNNYIDHFDPTNLDTYKQRFFESRDYFDAANPDSPVFLYIGCEGPVSDRWLTQGLMKEWAEKLHAQGKGPAMFVLEHRYYGVSHPTPDFSTANLKYLTTPNALEDLAHFVKSHPDLATRPWITFGGSYGGSLSYYARLKYPSLIAGAVSASGPFDPEIDFQDYLVVVEEGLKYYGGKQCVDNMEIANTYMKSIINSKDQTQYDMLTKELKLCVPLKVGMSDNERWSFWQSLADSFSGVAQYNHENGSNFNLKIVCDTMAQGTTAEDKFRNIIKVHNTVQDGECREWDWNWQIKQLGNLEATPDNNMRPWIYQTISAYGYYQTSQGKVRALGDHFPLSFFIDMNKAAYGQEWDLNRLELLSKRFNSSFAGEDHRVNGVIYTNGNIDPWSKLSVFRHNPNELVYSHFINGTSHCAPLYPSSQYDVAPLTQARVEMFKQLTDILAHFKDTLKSYAPTTWYYVPHNRLVTKKTKF